MSQRPRRIGVWAILIVLIVTLAGSAGAGGRATDAPRSAEASHDYVTVQLHDPAIASYRGGIQNIPATKPARGRLLSLGSPESQRYAAYLAGKRDEYRRWLQSNAPRAAVVREFSVVFNGFAIKLNGETGRNLSKGPGVAAVSPSFLVRPAMNVSPGVINAAPLWAAVGGQGNAGAGIKVGIIDTGIDTTNPFLSDAGYPSATQIDACAPFTKPGGGPRTNNKVVVCRYFTSGVAPGALVPPDALVVFDHATHVSGTVAGNAGTSGTVVNTTVTINNLSGVAPRALLGDYNVFPGFGSGFVAFGGSAFSHDIIAAIEAAVSDGMHVVNLSLGGSVQGPHDTLAEAVNATADAGVVPAIAAGNSGPGDGTVESPGSAARALTAGASTNPHFVGIPVTVGSTTIGAALGDFNNFGNVTAAYTVTSPANGCTTITTPLAGKLALIDRGACTFTTKIRNAQNAGAVGVLVVNNVAGDPTAMSHDGTSPFPTIPAAMLGKTEGNGIKPSGTATVNGTTQQEFITTNQDILAGFSSRGPTPFTYLIKPDFTAPGVNVLSSVFNGLFAFFQGTSMATPHVAGSAAVLKQAHPTWSPEDIKSALANTADRVVTDHVNGTVDPGVLARGGGRINLGNANGAPLTLDPVSVSFGLWTGNKNVTGSVSVFVRNVSGASQACSVSTTGPAIISASPTALALAAGATATVTVSINAGQSGQTGSGDYTGDVSVSCGSGTLLAPWWVRIDRAAKP